MRMGSFCSRSNCTATFRRSTWGGVAEGVGVGIGVWAGAEPRRVSNTRVTVMANLHTVPGLFIVYSSPVFITDVRRLQGTDNGAEILDGVLEHRTPLCAVCLLWFLASTEGHDTCLPSSSARPPGASRYL